MTTELSLQAEAALAELAEQFEDWRRSRTTGQERIPPRLWDQAVALSTVLALFPRGATPARALDRSAETGAGEASPGHA